MNEQIFLGVSFPHLFCSRVPLPLRVYLIIVRRDEWYVRYPRFGPGDTGIRVQRPEFET